MKIEISSLKAIETFQQEILSYYELHGRRFPWRETTDPYHILVSEIMLQQTQVSRVSAKYPQFIETFPTIEVLNGASLQEVLIIWQGMGYNRRAKALKEIAGRVVEAFSGIIPDEPELLQQLPMIGYATARSIAAFAFNKPVVFIETNIRRVFLHFFFQGREGVRDSSILPLVESTLLKEDPRRWYNALMDYGVHLAKGTVNPNRRSAHYTIQKPFDNSNRQVRGQILRYLARHGLAHRRDIDRELKAPEKQVSYCLDALEKEGFLVCEGSDIKLADN